MNGVADFTCISGPWGAELGDRMLAVLTDKHIHDGPVAFDLVIMSDVFYRIEDADALVGVVTQLCGVDMSEGEAMTGAGARRHRGWCGTRVIATYEHRRNDVNDFGSRLVDVARVRGLVVRCERTLQTVIESEGRRTMFDTSMFLVQN